MTAQTPDVLTDPVGVIVGLVVDVEPGLDRARISEVVADLAGGRAKRRRLAQALLARPGILTDGRSPAPEAIGKLLTALRDAGAVSVSAPVCTECGKAMRAFQRRGQDWYCGVHGPKTAACAVCGNVRPIAQRDRQHQPRCWQHPLTGEQDPTGVLIDLVTSIDPALDTQLVRVSIGAAAPQTGQRRRLAWALQDHPGLLTGAGAHAPVPAVLRLIDMLAERGSGRIVRPPCPGCGRVIALVKPRDGVRLCRNCVAKSRAETCSRCGSAPVATSTARRCRNGLASGSSSSPSWVSARCPVASSRKIADAVCLFSQASTVSGRSWLARLSCRACSCGWTPPASSRSNSLSRRWSVQRAQRRERCWVCSPQPGQACQWASGRVQEPHNGWLRVPLRTSLTLPQPLQRARHWEQA